MQRALAEAESAGARGEVPVGAVVTNPDGTILAADGNRTIELNDPTAHAEILAIRCAAARLGSERLAGCDIHSADHVDPAWQDVRVGDPFRLHPDFALSVALVEPPHALVALGQGGHELCPAAVPVRRRVGQERDAVAARNSHRAPPFKAARPGRAVTARAARLMRSASARTASAPASVI